MYFKCIIPCVFIFICTCVDTFSGLVRPVLVLSPHFGSMLLIFLVHFESEKNILKEIVLVFSSYQLMFCDLVCITNL